MYRKFLAVSMLAFLIISCQANPDSQFGDLPDSHLVFPFVEDKFKYINAVNWTYQNQLTVQGINPQAGKWPIYIGDITKGSLMPVVYRDHPISAYNPVISPNGIYLAFVPDSAENEHGVKIFELAEPIDNNFVLSDRQLSIAVENHVRLAWSPDSSQLAMLGFKDNDILVLSVYNVSMDSLKTMFEYSEKNLDKDAKLHIGRVEYSMSWSPNGGKLAFSLEYETENQLQSDLFVYYLNQNRLIRLTSTSTISERYPSWYPKEDILTYVSISTGTSSGINDGKLVFTTKDGSCTKILPKLEGIASPSWSPDGTQIVYLSRDGMEVMNVTKVIPQKFVTTSGLCN